MLDRILTTLLHIALKYYHAAAKFFEQLIYTVYNEPYSSQVNNNDHTNPLFIKRISFCLLRTKDTWDKVFKNGPSEICERQPLKNFKSYGLLKQTISHHFKLFKGCLPQVALASFLNNLSHMSFDGFCRVF